MRPLIAGITLSSLLFGFPVVVAVGALALSAKWRAWEVLFFGLLIDILYTPLVGFFGIPFLTTFLALVLVWGLEPIRARLYIS